MAIAKHLRIAKSDGNEAGLEFYLAQRMSKNQPAYKEITRKRTPEARLETYCKQFAGELGVRRTRQAAAAAQVNTTSDTPNEGLVAKLLAAILGTNAVEIEEEPVVEVDPLVEKFGETIAGQIREALGDSADALILGLVGDTPATPVAKARPKVAAGTITCQQAWVALGADPTYAPKQPDEPARNAQLYRLNTEGLLSVKA